MKRVATYIFIILCFVQVHGQENYIVRKVSFKGNFTLLTPLLLPQMTLQPQNGLARLIGGIKGVAFSFELLKNDMEQLQRFYQKEGFLNAEIRLLDLATNDKKETVDIILEVLEGPPTKVSEIKFVPTSGVPGDALLPILEKAKSGFSLHPGRRFRDEDMQHDLEHLATELINNGYAHAKTDFTLNVNQALHTVAVNFDVNAGPVCRFGDITISGNRHIDKKLVLRQVAFRKGDIFRRILINRTQEQVYALNVFHIVSVKATVEKNTQTTIPIYIDLKEAPRFTTRFGVGYGKEDLFRTFADVQWLRFFGGARRLNIFLKHSHLEPFHGNIRFTQPSFLTPNTNLGVNPFFRRQNEPGYKLERRGVNVYLQRQIRHFINTGITYTFERVNLDTSSVAEPELDPGLTDLYNKSGVLLGISRNSTDDIFAPTRGYNNSMTFKFNGIGQSDYNYTKWIIDLRGYRPLKSSVLAARINFGLISSLDANGFIPVEDRFFAGGANSVRGWARHELGPKDDNGQPRGGNELVEGSLELRIPLVGSFGFALFWDFGNVWEERPRRFYTHIRHAAGFGLRFRTPIGPVRFDIARPVFDAEDHYRWHFTIGEAF